MGGGGDVGARVYNAALSRRQALMGASEPAALLKNFRVFNIAAFACIGGVLHGYNQGMFSAVLNMPAFELRPWILPLGTLGLVETRRQLSRHGRSRPLSL